MSKKTKMQKKTKRVYRKKGLTTKGKGSDVNDVAGVSETFDFNNGQMETIYADYGCALSQHKRASTVASAYQEYRIKMVEYRFKPLSDTYIPGQGDIPYLYYLVDKLRSNNNLYTIDGFRNAGAKPIRFDDKTITVKFKPAVLLDNWDAQSLTLGVPRGKAVSPWLSTNDDNTTAGLFVPSSIDHLGIKWVVDGTSSDFQYAIERTIHVEFRKPMWNVTLDAPQLAVVDINTQVTSVVPKPPAESPPE